MFILTEEQTPIDNESLKTNLTNCLNVSIRVLLQCRHKGAIEAAGLSLGRLVNAITQNCDLSGILLESVEHLFEIIKRTDTTRRGAGFSILVHHLVKNDRGKDQVIFGNFHSFSSNSKSNFVESLEIYHGHFIGTCKYVKFVTGTR